MINLDDQFIQGAPKRVCPECGEHYRIKVMNAKGGTALCPKCFPNINPRKLVPKNSVMTSDGKEVQLGPREAIEF